MMSESSPDPADNMNNGIISFFAAKAVRANVNQTKDSS
jgi:hypothetical protein